MTTILLVRHGETEWNLEGRCQGQVDIPLNDTGRVQAQALGQWLAHRIGYNLEPLQFVISSDLLRAKQTAEIAAKAVGIDKIHLEEAWREIAFGVWEGLTWDEIRQRYPEIEQSFRENPEQTRIPEGETSAEVVTRAAQALQRLVETYPHGTGIVVSHGGILRFLISHLLGLPLRLSGRVRIFNCSTSVVQAVTGQIPKVIGFNDHSYLPLKLS